MAAGQNLLSVAAVKSAKKPGRYRDGGGLFLNVGKAGTKAWLFVFRSPIHRHPVRTSEGKIREMGLGSLETVTLAEARDVAADARRLIARGLDPLDERGRPDAVPPPTFRQIVDETLPNLQKGFRNEKHRAQWLSTLETYAASLMPLRIDTIDTAAVLAVLNPIWTEKAETANRLRGRIERMLDAAKATGHRSGENPACWKGHLEHRLSRRHKLQRGHHAALPWADVPAFIARLRQSHGMAALALEFTILTAARSGEVRGAKWGEIDLAGKVWTVPANRMKAGREHRVPLTDRAIAILKHVEPASDDSGFVFPGTRRSAPLSDMTLSAVLRRMKIGCTVHGFRASFKTWADEATSYQRELVEAALAHVVGDATERAYKRGDALERRRELMAAWAAHCEPERPSNVVPLTRPA